MSAPVAHEDASRDSVALATTANHSPKLAASLHTAPSAASHRVMPRDGQQAERDKGGSAPSIHSLDAASNPGTGGAGHNDLSSTPVVGGAAAAAATAAPTATSSAAAAATTKSTPLKSSSSPMRMFKFTLYETASRFFLIGADILDQRFRVLKVDRTGGYNDELGLSQDGTVYSKPELNELIRRLDEGNKASGGLKLRCTCWGLLGFIRFTGGYYMLVVTKRSQVALLGGHYVYRVDDTELISLNGGGKNRGGGGGGAGGGAGGGTGAGAAGSSGGGDPHPDEGRFLSIFNLLDLNNSFYFSYSYDMTNTLQHNLSDERNAIAQKKHVDREHKYNDMFVWNHHLLEPAARNLSSLYEWCIALIHGYVDQSKLSVLGRPIYLTLIARRSRFFAGARFLKRGANDLGYVANDVETEQIVSEMQTTPFHAPGPKPFANPNYTSYVQHRGSIPLHWSQENSGVSPKPDIDLNLVDPFYTAASLHFNNLFDRYGAPIFVLNLVKAKERTPRESKLLKEYAASITYLNQFLPRGKQILYRAWDMSRASKNDQNVIGTLESIAEDIVAATGFFRNGDVPGIDMRVQNGVSRTNCIDCLDRTNAAQSVIGKVALAHQLHALGILDSPTMEYDTDVVNLFTHMYHNHGDTIAIQYGGSHLVNTMETYRKTNQWSSQSRDMVESLKRYVNNSFLDAQRQEAYNLFLGNYIFAQGQPMLWELPSDYYLHHADPRRWAANQGRNYVNWYDKTLLEDRSKRMEMLPHVSQEQNAEAEKQDDYWPEYYRPLALTSFGKVFANKLPSTLEYVPYKSTNDGGYDPSPFRVRVSSDQHQHQFNDDLNDTAAPKKNIRIIEPTNRPTQAPKASYLVEKESQYPDRRKGSVASTKSLDDDLGDKRGVTQSALNQLVKGSLHPSVQTSHLAEYSQYLTHSENVELLHHGDEVFSPQAFEYANYVQMPNNFDSPEVAHLLEEDLTAYNEYLDVEWDPLTIKPEDLPKKRYTAYRKWLRGKSLFKQSRIDTYGTTRVS